MSLSCEVRHISEAQRAIRVDRHWLCWCCVHFAVIESDYSLFYCCLLLLGPFSNFVKVLIVCLEDHKLVLVQRLLKVIEHSCNSK